MKTYIVKKISSDLLWSIAALCLMNGTIQALIYPMLNRWMGTEKYGDMLFLMGIASLFSVGIGVAINNTRLILRKEETSNNVFFKCIVLFYVPAAIIVGMIGRAYLSISQTVLLLVLMFIMTLRYYGDVEYRLSLNYRGYFIYYLILICGYIVGVLLYSYTDSWLILFLLGEIACITFCTFKGSVFKVQKYSGNMILVLNTAASIVVANLLYSSVVQLDRIILKYLMGSHEVTIFYVASLLGKIIALIVGPMNAIIISYLSRYDKVISQKQVIKLSLLFFSITTFFYICICIVTPFIIRLLYDDIYAEVMSIAMVANLGQVLCFTGSLLLNILLIYAPSSWQTVTQGGYVLIFFVGAAIGVKLGGLKGFAIATVVAAMLRLIVTFSVLMYISKHKGRINKDENWQISI